MTDCLVFFLTRSHSQFRDSRKCLSFWTYALPACVVFYFSIYYHIFVSPFNPFIPTFISSLIHFCLPKKVGCLWPWAPKFSKTWGPSTWSAIWASSVLRELGLLKSTERSMDESSTPGEGCNRGENLLIAFFFVKNWRLFGYMYKNTWILDIYEHLEVWDLWAYREFTKEWCHW